MLPPTPIIKANQWSCEITAYAMATNRPVSEFINLIGHNGGEIAFPGMREPFCRRGFHHQELIMASMLIGFTVTPFELIPASIPKSPDPHQAHEGRNVVHPLLIDTATRRSMFLRLIEGRRGVLTGRCRVSHHAVTFYMGLLIDPDGDTYPFSFKACEARGFYPSCLWIVDECQLKTSKS